MGYRIVFHPIAEEEYQDAYRWYQEQLQGLGDRFEETVEHKLGQISSKPMLFPKKRGVFREAKVEVFPYQIIYKIYEKKKTLFITAVYHTSRNPKKKYRK